MTLFVILGPVAYLSSTLGVSDLLLRLLDAILDLSGIENGYIWNSIHFAFDGGFSLLRLDIPNSIQLYPKRNREKNGIPSNRDRI